MVRLADTLFPRQDPPQAWQGSGLRPGQGSIHLSSLMYLHQETNLPSALFIATFSHWRPILMKDKCFLSTFWLNL